MLNDCSCEIFSVGYGLFENLNSNLQTVYLRCIPLIESLEELLFEAFYDGYVTLTLNIRRDAYMHQS